MEYLTFHYSFLKKMVIIINKNLNDAKMRSILNKNLNIAKMRSILNKIFIC